MKRWSMMVVCLVIGFTSGSYLVGTWTHGQNAVPAPETPNPAVTGIPQELASYRDVVKRVLPAVVSIECRAKVTKVQGERRVQPLPFDDPAIPEEFRRFFEEFRRAPGLTPGETPRVGYGSGFFIDPSGVIVTNNHVVANADAVCIELKDGRQFFAKDVRTDPRTDLAVVILDVQGEKFPYLELGDSEQMEIGDRVLAVGAPFGLAGSVTSGIISAKGRTGMNLNMYEDFLQTDAAINPGNSGGPLVNLEGKVVGINAAIRSRGVSGFQGVGFAVASNLAKNVIHALRTEGVVRRGYLGVQIRELSPDVAERLGVKEAGILISDVFDDTPAAKAGLKAGDVVTHIAGKPVQDGKALQGIVAALPIGKEIRVNFVREGQAETTSVTIEEQPTDFGSAGVPAPRAPRLESATVPLEQLGIAVGDLTDSMANDLGYRTGTRGVVITQVEPGSLGAESGLRRGMLLSKIDNQPVRTAAEVRQAMENASLNRGVLLQVQSPQGGTNFILIRNSETR